MEPITTTTIAVAAASWSGAKLLGATFENMGKDLNQLYQKGKDKIIANATKKTPNIDDGGQTNLRVTRDVFWNGSFADESICAEYFGGILAASRSIDGKNDAGIFYLDIIKSLSSGQLKMHYLIYRMLNKLLISNEQKKSLNPAQEAELGTEKLFFVFSQNLLKQFAQEDVVAILHGLSAKNIIHSFQTKTHESENKQPLFYYAEISPKSLGIQLFAMANNKFSNWYQFSTHDFGDFDEINLPEYFAQSKENLLAKTGTELLFN